jgi:hypothetical protein
MIHGPNMHVTRHPGDDRCRGTRSPLGWNLAFAYGENAMAINKPIGDNTRKGAVRKRSQLKVKVKGDDRLDQAGQGHWRVHGAGQNRKEV